MLPFLPWTKSMRAVKSLSMHARALFVAARDRGLPVRSASFEVVFVWLSDLSFYGKPDITNHIIININLV